VTYSGATPIVSSSNHRGVLGQCQKMVEPRTLCHRQIVTDSLGILANYNATWK